MTVEGYIEYHANNSGGRDWLNDSHWEALRQAGWKTNGNWEATRRGLSLRDAIAEWERVTGLPSNALGCSCCGPPHSFGHYSDSDEYLDSYSPEYPSYGAEYE